MTSWTSPSRTPLVFHICSLHSRFLLRPRSRDVLHVLPQVENEKLEAEAHWLEEENARADEMNRVRGDICISFFLRQSRFRV